MRMRLLLGLAVVLAAVGCGSKKFAPVSGKVTMNGKALAGATVAFQPIAEKGNAEVAPGSTGKTDANGQFTLKNTKGEPGAWVGKHRVLISLHAVDNPEDDSRPRGGPPQKDTIPARYNSESKETFVVPPGGTKEANFTLTSP
jgi:hypothetical protein